jgi:hypothetical protein
MVRVKRKEPHELAVPVDQRPGFVAHANGVKASAVRSRFGLDKLPAQTLVPVNVRLGQLLDLAQSSEDPARLLLLEAQKVILEDGVVEVEQDVRRFVPSTPPNLFPPVSFPWPTK